LSIIHLTLPVVFVRNSNKTNINDKNK